MLHDEIMLDNGSLKSSSLETGLTFDRSEEWKQRVFVQMPRGSFGYRIKFDEPLRQEDYITSASYNNVMIMPFLGKNLRIFNAGNPSNRNNNNYLYADLVQSYTLKSGNGAVVYLDGVRTVLTLMSVSNTHADVQVQISGRNPVQRDVILEGQTKLFSFPNSNITNITVTATNLVDQDGTRNDEATFYIGTNPKFYINSGPFIGEDSLDPIYVWHLENLNTANPTIEVKNAFSIDNWDLTQNPLIKHQHFYA